ncbi:MAG: hypothetical protein HDR08_04490 [Lachnospiraceae bacterium]|nr:hypothetical protein [Lachnospiraceae bacterium]
MKNEKVRKNAITFLLVQLIAWAGFTMVDFIEETTSNNFEDIAVFGIPIAVVAVYAFMRKQNWQPDLKYGKWVALILLYWLGMTAGVTAVVMKLIDQDKWIVYQAAGGWEHFLNGLEYAVFGIMLAVIPIVLVSVGELLVWVIIKGKRKSPRP